MRAWKWDWRDWERERETVHDQRLSAVNLEQLEAGAAVTIKNVMKKSRERERWKNEWGQRNKWKREREERKEEKGRERREEFSTKQKADQLTDDSPPLNSSFFLSYFPSLHHIHSYIISFSLSLSYYIFHITFILAIPRVERWSVPPPVYRNLVSGQ